jgi:hypothetical protein
MGPSVFTAVQERLGLKLEPGTAAFDTVVIDHAEKTVGELTGGLVPSSNSTTARRVTLADYRQL